MPLRVDISDKQNGTYIISPVGSIDSFTADALDKKVSPILSKSPKAIMLNMAGVEYISSRGISVVFKIKKLIEASGGSFIMTALRPQIKKVFDIMNALPSMNVFASEEEADSYLAEMQKRKQEEGDSGDDSGEIVIE